MESKQIMQRVEEFANKILVQIAQETIEFSAQSDVTQKDIDEFRAMLTNATLRLHVSVLVSTFDVEDGGEEAANIYKKVIANSIEQRESRQNLAEVAKFADDIIRKVKETH